MTLDPLSREPSLRGRIHDRLVDLVVAGRLAPGAAVTEAALARQLEVSRTPVREALLLLEGEGLLESSPARGFVVRGLSRAEADELYPTLTCLEVFAVRGGPGLDAEARAELERIAGELESSREPRRRWELDSAWHDTLTRAGGNSYLAGLASQVRASMSRYELTYMTSQVDRGPADRQHRDILARLEEGDPEAAAQVLELHWHQGHRAVLDAMGDQDVAR